MSPSEIKERRVMRTIRESDVDRWVAIAVRAVLKFTKEVEDVEEER